MSGPTKVLEFEATVGKVNHRVDNAVSVPLTTATEFDDEGYFQFHAFRQSEVRVMLIPGGATGKTEVETPPKPETKEGDRSPSQKLRDIIYRQYEYVDKNDWPEFDGWYRHRMGKAMDAERWLLKSFEKSSY